MAKVMGEVVALVLENIDVFILNFPAGTAGSSQEIDILTGHRMIGNPTVVIELFTGDFMRNGQLEPVNQKCILTSPNGHLVDEPIRPDFPMTAIPMAF